MVKHVQILLATYNAAKYIEPLLVSLSKQTYSNWSIITRDNGSSDSTLEAVDQYSRDNPGRVLRLQDKLGNIGACSNFGKLLEASTADYIMFCDADDIWIEDKIENAVSEITRLESIHGPEIPLLVHTDLTVTDRDMKVISRSYWNYQNINPSRIALPQLLVQNVITGCTCIINKALRERAAPIPPEAIMHDWWLALVASLFGRISHLNKSSIYYRQHGANDTGAKQWNFFYVLRRLQDESQIREQITRYQLQAQCLLNSYANALDKKQFEILTDFATLSRYGKIKKISTLIRHGILKNGATRNIGILTYI